MENRVGNLYKPKGRKYWYLKIKVGGRWGTFSTGCKTRPEAEKVRQRVIDNVAAGRDPFESDNSVGPKLRDLFERYLKYCELHNSPNTVWDRRRYCKRLLKFIGDVDANRISRADVESYKENRLIEKIGNRTINEELKTLRQAFNYAIRLELLEKNPARAFGRLKENQREIKVLSKGELKKYFDWCRENDTLLYDVSVLAFHLGLRKGDILKIHSKDVDLGNRMLRVEMSKTGRVIYRPLNEAAYGVLTRRAKKGWVFPSAESTTGHVEDFKRNFRKALDGTRLDFQFRDFRALHAIYMRLAGVDQYTIQRSLGHQKQDVTIRHYMELAENEMEKAIKELEKAY
jgi:integrase